MSPPRRRATEPHQACGLRGNAVGRHQLLLLAHGVQEPEGVGAKADHAEGPERHEAQPRALYYVHALACPGGGEREEGQQDPGGDLHPHARDDRARRGAQAWAGPHGQRQRAGEQQEDQRVVVCPAHGQLEQHGVQAHECGRPAPGVAEAAGGPRDQRDRAETRGDRDGLEGPEAAREPQRGGRVARECEQRPVGGMQVGPPDEREDRVGGGFSGHVRVGVKAVQCPQAGEAQIAEDVLGDQRRAQEQDQVRRHDRRDEGAHGQGSGAGEHDQVAGAHDQHQRLEAALGDAHAEALQGPRQPPRPAAPASGDVLRGLAGDARGQQKDGRDHAEQPQPGQRPQGAGPSPRAHRRPPARRRPRGSLQGRYGGRGQYRPIVTSRRPASV